MVYQDEEQKLGKSTYELCYSSLAAKINKKRNVQNDKDYVNTEACAPANIKKGRLEVKYTKISQKLKQRRQKAEEEQSNLMNQWSDLHEKEIQFQEYIRTYDKFILSNREKQARELHKYKHMHKQRLKMTKASTRMRNMIKIQNATVDQYLDQLRKHMIYEEYVTTLLESMKFKSGRDVIMRYTELSDTIALLRAKTLQSEDEGLTFTRKYIRIMGIWKERILHLTQILASRRERYELARREGAQWEDLVNAIREQAEERMITSKDIHFVLDDMISMLMTRLCAKMPLEDLRHDLQNYHMLTTQADKVSYLKSMLKVLVKSHKLDNIKSSTALVKSSTALVKSSTALAPFKENTFPIHSESRIPAVELVEESLQPVKKTYKYSALSPGTKEILEEIKKRIHKRTTDQYGRRIPEQSKKHDISSILSDSTSISEYSMASKSTKSSIKSIAKLPPLIIQENVNSKGVGLQQQEAFEREFSSRNVNLDQSYISLFPPDIRRREIENKFKIVEKYFSSVKMNDMDQRSIKKRESDNSKKKPDSSETANVHLPNIYSSKLPRKNRKHGNGR